MARLLDSYSRTVTGLSTSVAGLTGELGSPDDVSAAQAAAYAYSTALGVPSNLAKAVTVIATALA
jgi:hypothetical protein